jgi:site-specific DNA recombinase
MCEPAEMTTTDLRVGIYTRQSYAPGTDELAVIRQEQIAREICERDGHTNIVAVLVDNDRSATNGKRREDYERMVEMIANRDVDMIVAYNMDRLNRDPAQYLQLCSLAAQTRVVFKTSEGIFDPNNELNEFVGLIATGVAQMENKRKVARHKAAHKQRRESGHAWWPQRPFGYTMPKRIANTKQFEPPELVEREAKAVRDAYSAILAGVSLKSVARQWNDAGLLTPRGNQWSGMAVRQTLLSARNAGIRTYAEAYYVRDGMEKQRHVRAPQVVLDKATGAPVRGDWPPIVDEQIWRGVVAMLRSPERGIGTPFPKRKYLLSGLLRCGVCGEQMTGTSSPGRRPGYVCTHCTKVRRSVEDVDAWVESRVIHWLLREDASREIETASMVDHNAKLTDLDDQIAAVESSQLALAEEVDTMPFAAWKAAVDKLTRTLAGLNSERAIVLAKMPSSGGGSLLGLPGDIDARAAWFESRDEDQRRAIVAEYFDIVVDPGQVPRRAFNTSLVRVVAKPLS